MTVRDPLLKAALFLACVLAYFACGTGFANMMGANELSVSWWALTLAWPVVVSVYFSITFACIAFAVGLGLAAVRTFPRRQSRGGI